MPTMGLDWAELQSLWEEVRWSGYFTEGKMVRMFEEEVSKWSGLHAVAVNSAGTGLYAMLRCHFGGRQDASIVCPANTFWATGGMVFEAGHSLGLVDCRTDDFSMSVKDLADTYPHPADVADVDAVILTHVGGGLAKDYYDIRKWCEENNAVLFEDAAHALGAQQHNRTAGFFSKAAVFSLYATKALPVGEGGVIVTEDEMFAEQLREFRNYGKYMEGGSVKYRGVGMNFRMDEWSAAIAYLQMKRLSDIMEKRHAAMYHLSKVIPPMISYDGASNWYKYPVRVEEAKELGVKRFTGKIYQSSDQLHKGGGFFCKRHLPGTEYVAEAHVCLPLDEDLYKNLSKDQIIRYLRRE